MKGIWLAILVALALGSPSSAWAWGANGHHLILDLAYARLTPSARAEFDRLLAAGPAHAVEGCPLANRDQLATWPDCVRFKDPFKATYDEHFDDIPLFGAAQKHVYCKNSICASEAIKRDRRVLANHRLSEGERLEALSFLVHYVGDIHQPLHAANNEDKGGNDVKVIYLGQASYPGRNGEPALFNLHGIWDTPIAEAAMAEDGRTAIAQLVDANQRKWAGFNPDRWAREAHAIAARVAYGGLPTTMTPGGAPVAPVSVDQSYVDAAIPVVRVQLARATARLADVLNATLQ